MKSWKKKQKNSLIITGARQIGKTFIVREFAREEYWAFYGLNFLENPELKKIFAGSLHADELLLLIRTYYPNEKHQEGNTLIFFDEAQECPESITALKFLSKDRRFDVIVTGSALGMAFRQVTSFPVGHVEYFDMCSLDFEEFLWAKEIETEVIESLGLSYEGQTKVHEALHIKFMDLIREYLILGGMPEVVQTFVGTGDYLKADEVQRRLHRDYLADIARFAEPGSRIKAISAYQSIPRQLSKENHKFQYGVIDGLSN